MKKITPFTPPTPSIRLRPHNRSPHLPTFELMGDYWNLRILYSLIWGGRSFSSIARALDNLNPSTLTKKLNRLKESKIIKQDGRIFSLTALGRKSVPVLISLEDFSLYLSKNKS